jgi:hypothetical protein
MAMTIVESTRPVTGGVDTHADVHVAAAVDANGGVLGVKSFATTPTGLRELHGWLVSFGVVEQVGVEGTGAYGAGLARCLRGAGMVVIEVDRPNRQERRRNGKSDELDAIEAARAALSGRASGIAKSADGDVEAIRALLVVRRSGRNVRIKYLNQIRHLGFTAPADLRERLRDVHADRLARVAAGLRPTAGSDSVVYATKLAIATLGRRVLALEADADRLDRELETLATLRARAAERLRRRRQHRGAAVGRRRRQPTPTQERSRVRASLRRRAAARLVRKSGPSPTQPRWEPPSQPCPVADRVHAHERRRTHPQIRRASNRRRPINTRSHAGPEAIRRPRALPAPRTRLIDRE